ncbi:copper chaperone for superoxide dismutase [Platysternon megacephalum]|uniref:Copper chaperone for superoxide dismutase n=1 Tax=Platysternon megacephalum TaxID=55544 RepID=A0A4D9EZL7_9SAUR|nr:copper chaperone for superoxide dismutase [Platysternon megacephalum]
MVGLAAGAEVRGHGALHPLRDGDTAGREASKQLVAAECESADILFPELGNKLLYLSPFPPAVNLRCEFQDPLFPQCSAAWSLPADPCPTSGAKRKDVEE